MAAAAATKKETEMNIFQRINAISQEAGALAPESKGGVPFAFRGIDGTVAHLTPFMHKYGVFAAPEVLESIVTEREIINPQTGTPNGKLVKTTQLTVKYTFYAPDGSSVTTVSAGLADDFGDRSTAQAMSVAYRIALLQLFHLPTHTKEPEETGEAVLQEREAPAAGAASQSTSKAVRGAQAAAAGAKPPVTGNLTQVRGRVKELGDKLGKTSDELNALGVKFGEQAGVEDWFGSLEAMTLFAKGLEAEYKAAEAKGK